MARYGPGMRAMGSGPLLSSEHAESPKKAELAFATLQVQGSFIVDHSENSGREVGMWER